MSKKRDKIQKEKKERIRYDLEKNQGLSKYALKKSEEAKVKFKYMNKNY